MDVRRRNRITTAIHAPLLSGARFLMLWALLQAGGRQGGMGRGPAAVVAGVVAVALYLWTRVRQRRDERELDALAKDSGIDPHQVPQEPLPLIPPLARGLNELSAGILFLVLTIAVFVAYYAGWID